MGDLLSYSVQPAVQPVPHMCILSCSLIAVITPTPASFVEKLPDLFDLKSCVFWSELVVIPGGSPQDVDPPKAPTDTIFKSFFSTKSPCILHVSRSEQD